MAIVSNIFREIEKFLDQGHPVAIASIVGAKGSAPRHRGARCGVLTDGAVIGTIGGGLLEANTQKLSQESLADGRARLLEMSLDNKKLAPGGMVCGGSVEIAVVPWTVGELPIAREAAAALDGGPSAILVTSWNYEGRSWTQDLWRDGAWLWAGVEVPDLPELLLEVQASGKAVMRGSQACGVVLEPLLCQYTPLLILGGGHVGRALAQVASATDFAVTVVDDRPEFANAENIPWAKRVLCHPFEGAVAAAGTGPSTFVVVCTRDHLSDTECTEEAMRSDAPYVGVIASRRKRDMILEYLNERGISDERLAALRMPVGLPIGAETPEEIAVSAVAEMVQERHRPAQQGKKQAVAQGVADGSEGATA
jgi:xanthine dehydrogenase accessory factor